MDDFICEKVQALISDCDSFCNDVDLEVVKLILGDDFLRDLYQAGKNITEKDIGNALALHCGRAMRLLVCRADGDTIPIIILNDGSVGDVYLAVADAFNRVRDAEQLIYDSLVQKVNPKDKKCVVDFFSKAPPPRRLHWRKFWRTYSLVCDGIPLSDRNDSIKNIPELKKGAVLRFVRKKRKTHA